MNINKTEEFFYFQNKAKHYETIRNIKPTVKDKLETPYLKTISHPHSEKKKRLVPILREILLKQQNQNMISRIANMTRSPRTQLEAEGNYSRYNKVQRKFRSLNPHQKELNRTINIQNSQLKSRLQHVKAKVGDSKQWKRHKGKTLSLRKNMSRYLENNRSKGSLHISTDRFVPSYYGSYLDKNLINDPASPRQVEITKEGLLELPGIGGIKNSHAIRYAKNKLVIDRSNSSLVRETKGKVLQNSQMKTRQVKSKHLQISLLNPEQSVESDKNKQAVEKKQDEKIQSGNKQLTNKSAVEKSSLTVKEETPRQHSNQRQTQIGEKG